MSVGIIAEYNPFHNGHLYHLNKIKEMYKDETIILVINSYFTERGDINFITKWDRTSLALHFGIDLVVELPFVYGTQSADLFARGSVEILHNLNVDKIVFGSETGNIDLLKEIASIDLNNTDLKEYMSLGLSYPSAISKFVYNKMGFKLEKPNDILGVCYIREINRLNSNIKPICIKRTNEYNSLSLEKISSATSIRNAFKDKINTESFMPEIVFKYIRPHYTDELFPFIKYKILTDDNLSRYQTVDEGIEYRLKKHILKSNSLEEFIKNVKTKRYTYNKIKRMLIHILCNFTKEEAKDLKLEYIRVLGFNDKGQKYLNKIKKEVKIPILTKYKSYKNLDIEIRSTAVYSLLDNDTSLIEQEYKNRPKK